MAELYRRVELEEGCEILFVGVHALRWNSAWGEPAVGFVEYDAEPSDFIQIGDKAIQVVNITGVIFKPRDGDDVDVYCIDDPGEPFAKLRGNEADAFRSWWETKASVNVLYVAQR